MPSGYPSLVQFIANGVGCRCQQRSAQHQAGSPATAPGAAEQQKKDGIFRDVCQLFQDRIQPVSRGVGQVWLM